MRVESHAAIFNSCYSHLVTCKDMISTQNTMMMMFSLAPPILGNSKPLHHDKEARGGGGIVTSVQKDELRVPSSSPVTSWPLLGWDCNEELLRAA